MVSLTFPVDLGVVGDHLIVMGIILIQICNTCSFWPSLIASCVTSLYYHFIVKCYIYDMPLDSQLISVAVVGILNLLISSCLLSLFLKWVGTQFVEAETRSMGNEALLNNLKEGILITDEQHSGDTFINMAAKRLLVTSQSGLVMNPVANSDTFDKSRKHFCQIDASVFDFGDSLPKKDRVI